MTRATATKSKNVTLWVAQALLALLFLFAGVMKFVMPIDVLAQQSQLPGLFVRFIGTCEIFGALGLVLPGIFRICTGLTGIAAFGLVLIMTGATTIGVERAQIAAAVPPFIIGVIAAFVAINRWHVKAAEQTAQPVAFRRAA
jgi:uncharacterized membrane protein YphA (DoxX/SURF4 family)